MEFGLELLFDDQLCLGGFELPVGLVEFFVLLAQVADRGLVRRAQALAQFLDHVVGEVRLGLNHILEAVALELEQEGLTARPHRGRTQAVGDQQAHLAQKFPLADHVHHPLVRRSQRFDDLQFPAGDDEKALADIALPEEQIAVLEELQAHRLADLGEFEGIQVAEHRDALQRDLRHGFPSLSVTRQSKYRIKYINNFRLPDRSLWHKRAGL